MSEFKIEKGIEIPKSGHKPTKYFWGDMERGDSVFLPGITSTAQVSGSIATYKKNHGGMFTSRKVEGGVRVWRIE